MQIDKIQLNISKELAFKNSGCCHVICRERLKYSHHVTVLPPVSREAFAVVVVDEIGAGGVVGTGGGSAFIDVDLRNNNNRVFIT